MESFHVLVDLVALCYRFETQAFPRALIHHWFRDREKEIAVFWSYENFPMILESKMNLELWHHLNDEIQYDQYLQSRTCPSYLEITPT